jgi:lysophospholipid acyltransferase (LPLAT)-like uncharacterized protein
LKTWDRFVIPKPFSRVRVTMDEAFIISRGMDAGEFEAQRLKLESLLVNGTDDA